MTRAVWSVGRGGGGELLVELGTGRIVGAAYPRACLSGDGWIAETEGEDLEGFFVSLEAAKRDVERKLGRSVEVVP